MDCMEVRNKVLIVGNGESRHEAPFADLSYDVWSTSTVRDIPRHDTVFEIHPTVGLDEEGMAIKEFVVNSECTVYMQKVHEKIPNSMPYPLQEVIDKYGRYLTNSVAYMLALALFHEYKEIGVYGVSMEHDTEYGRQRASCEYWIGLARGMGVKVDIAASSDLCKAYYLYGYEENPMLKKFNMMSNVTTERITHVEEQFKHYEKQKHRYQGQQEVLDYILNYFE